MFNGLFGYLLVRAKDDLLRSIIALYERSDWPEALQHTKGAFTRIANLAEEVGELEVTQIAREMREECMPYFEKAVPVLMVGSFERAHPEQNRQSGLYPIGEVAQDGW